jgi:hypothetical protein
VIHSVPQGKRIFFSHNSVKYGKVRGPIREIRSFVDLAQNFSGVIQVRGAVDHQIYPKRWMDQRKFPVHGLTPFVSRPFLFAITHRDQETVHR